MLILAFLLIVALPTGGKCFDGNGHLCAAAPNLPCPAEVTAPIPCGDCVSVKSVTSDGQTDCGECRFVDYDNAPHKRVNMAHAFAALWAIALPNAPVFTPPVSVVAHAAYFPTGPPRLRLASATPACPRAPPHFS